MLATMIEWDTYIAPDGTAYDLTVPGRPGRWVLSEGGWGTPPIEHLTHRGPYQHGATVRDSHLRPRLIQLVLRADGCDRAEYWTLRAALMNQLRPNRQLTAGGVLPGQLRKNLPDGSQRSLDVFIGQGPRFEGSDSRSWDEWAFTEILRFVAHSPTVYNPTRTDTALTVGSATVVTYPGSWPALPTILITGPVANPMVNIAYGAITDPFFYPQGVQLLNPAGYWRLGEASGNALDSSGNGNDGTVSGVTQGQPGLLAVGTATSYEFNGASGDITVPAAAAINDLFAGGGTALLLMQADSDGQASQGRAVGKVTWGLITFEESGGACRLRFNHSFSTTSGIWKTTDLAITIGQIHKVAITYDSSAVTNDPVIYVDGVAVPLDETQTPVGTASSDAANDLVIGNSVGGGVCFDGFLQEVTLGRWELTAAEVMDQAQYAFGRFSSTVALDYTIPSGEVVTIDLTGPAKTVVDDSGVNHIDKVALGSSLGTLALVPAPGAPGGANRVTAGGLGTTGVTAFEIRRHDRYWGI